MNKELENVNFEKIMSEVADQENNRILEMNEIAELVDEYTANNHLTFNEIVKKYDGVRTLKIDKTIREVNNDLKEITQKFDNNKDFIIDSFEKFVGVSYFNDEEKTIYNYGGTGFIEIDERNFTKCNIEWICDFENHLKHLHTLVNTAVAMPINNSVVLSIINCFLETFVLHQKIKNTILASTSNYDTISDSYGEDSEMLGNITYEEIEKLINIFKSMEYYLVDILSYLFVYINKYEIEKEIDN